MNSYTFHINLYDLAFLGAIFIGLTLTLLLWYTKTINRSANRFLALALVTMILWMIRILAIDLRLETYLPHWDWLPLEFLLALGPLLYFYVLKITCPQHKFSWKSLLHFSPLLLEQAALALEIKESARTGATTYATHIFQQVNPVLQLLIFISIITYLRRTDKLIKGFYRRLQPVLMDRSLLKFRWLRRLLGATALLWFLWIVCAAINYFGYRNQPGIQLYYPFYIFFVVIIIWTAAAAFLKPQAAAVAQTAAPVNTLVPAELRSKGTLLKKAIEANLYYRDPELSLGSLAEKLGMQSYELSKVINTVFKKSFNDLINEYRIHDMVSKMRNPANDHFTLAGLAYDAGFNSKATFNRAFKQVTGKSPLEYKNKLKKESSSYNLRRHIRPELLILNREPQKCNPLKLNGRYMFRNYLKIAWRNTLRNKGYSFINISGLAIGMAVTMLITFWIWDELSYNKNFSNYNHIVRLKQNSKAGSVTTLSGMPIPLAVNLKTKFSSDFKNLSLASTNQSHILAYGDKMLEKSGMFVQPEFTKIFSLYMVKGFSDPLNDPYSIVINRSLATAMFGEQDPLNKLIKLDNNKSLKVSGVFEDFIPNSEFSDAAFLIPWEFYVADQPWVKRSESSWNNNAFQIFAELQDHSNPAAVQAKIFGELNGHERTDKPEVLLQVMNRWHLYNEYKDGKNTGGDIQFIWMFGIIGFFVLLMACINFMNLGTARSEKRAKEVGIRKAVGCLRQQLILQFFIESVLTAFVAFCISIVLVLVILPWFNQLSGKQMTFFWSNGWFWVMALGLTLFSGIIAGSYPAFYLSSFNSIKVLKGTFRAGRLASLPRKVLVVVQFSISIALIIATIVIYLEIQFAKDRPVGYSRAGLVTVDMNTPELHQHYDAIRNDLIGSGAVIDIAESSSPTTFLSNSQAYFNWSGKDPGINPWFGVVRISPDFGKTVGWHFKEGRDFSRDFKTDSAAIIMNESAEKFIGLRQSLGENISHDVNGNIRKYKIIGVIDDMLMESPFDPIKPTFYILDPADANEIIVKVNPVKSMQEALSKIEMVFKKYNPGSPFVYRFAEDDYARKFVTEGRLSNLATFFAAFAIFISCLGLFGLSSFTAEQRSKEIGLRKVLGASVFVIWKLLTKDFLILVGISLWISSPVSYYIMHRWLQNHVYRISIGWWIFALAGIGAMTLTLITVSYQSIKAALANPVKSIRIE